MATDPNTRLSPSQMETLAVIVKYFTDRGWSIFAAYGIAANIFAECSFRIHLWGDGKKAFGVCQWHPPRRAAYQKLHGRAMEPDASLEQQLSFVIHEMTKGSDRDARKAGQLLMGARTAREAAAHFSRYYERPRLRDQEASRRGTLAQNWFDQFVPKGSGDGQQAAAAS